VILGKINGDDSVFDRPGRVLVRIAIKNLTRASDLIYGLVPRIATKVAETVARFCPMRAARSVPDGDSF
jgi:hypothetical protein